MPTLKGLAWVGSRLCDKKGEAYSRASKGINRCFNAFCLALFLFLALTQELLPPPPAFHQHLLFHPGPLQVRPPHPLVEAFATVTPLVFGIVLLAWFFRSRGPAHTLSGQLRWLLLGTMTLAIATENLVWGLGAFAVLFALMVRAASHGEWTRFLRPLPALPSGSRIEAVRIRARGSTCRVCGEAIEDDLVVCRDCGTPHHGSCWKYAGKCTVYACGCSKSAQGIV